MESRIIDIEIRLTHQEAAIDALTQASLEQQRKIEDVLGQLQTIRMLLQQLAPPDTAMPEDEPPPPHY